MLRVSIKNQFRLGTGLILVVFCLGASLLVYKNLERQSIEFVQDKVEIYLLAANSIRSYVKDTLRPQVQKTLGSDQFILEAMSTSYISRNIMKLLKTDIPEFQYKRAAKNPRNPVNQADSFELEKLKWFQNNPNENRWSGLIEKDGSPFYTELMTIVAEKECLQCHGIPERAPEGMTRIYGLETSYGFNVGDVVAADTIYIPMIEEKQKIKEKAWLVFVIALAFLSLLAILIITLFNRTAVVQLRGTLNRFHQFFNSENKPLRVNFDKVGDEFEQIQGTFNKAADQLKDIHDELKTSERKYRQLYESSPNVIFICNGQFEITDLNPSGMKLFNIQLNTKQSIGGSLPELFLYQDDFEQFSLKLKSGQSVWDQDYKMKTFSGKTIEVVLSANSIMRDDQQFRGIEGVIRDITQRKQLDKYLAQTERLAAIGQLAAGIAHEINNPLGVIQCYANLISKNASTVQQNLDDIEVIVKHTQNCKTIVESLLNFARAGEPQFSDTDLHRCLDELISVLNRQMIKQGVIVERQYDQNMDVINVDESKIKQVFMNLILNSIQAMTHGGIIKLATYFDFEQNLVSIKIKDNGTGISSEHLDKVFEPFFTTKEPGKGTGLGLSVSYGIISQHDGEIAVSSQKDKGTEFKITLPIKNENRKTDSQIS